MDTKVTCLLWLVDNLEVRQLEGQVLCDGRFFFADIGEYRTIRTTFEEKTAATRLAADLVQTWRL